MAGPELIDEYLRDLAGRLPRSTVEELADGLLETWRQHRDRGLDPAAAARVAVAEFGSPDRIVAAFVAQAPGRRAARALLATGPVAGLCWGGALLSARAWRWPAPAGWPAGWQVALLAVPLLAVAAALAAAATAGSYRRTWWAPVGGLGLAALDALMVARVLRASPGPGGLMTLAITASVVRITLTMYSMRAQLLDIRRSYPPRQT